jgi:ribosomal protein S18 acetylase RimI-like enzyme
VAEQGDAVVGEGIALVRQHKKGRSGRIYSLAVRQQHRGQRIGQKLLQAMLVALAERGVSRVYLEVDQANDAAIRLYAGHGFHPIGVLPDYYGPGRTGVHMMAETAPLMTVTRSASKSA